SRHDHVAARRARDDGYLLGITRRVARLRWDPDDVLSSARNERIDELPYLILEVTEAGSRVGTQLDQNDPRNDEARLHLLKRPRHPLADFGDDLGVPTSCVEQPLQVPGVARTHGDRVADNEERNDPERRGIG